MTCILPGSITAGLTFKRTVTLSAYPADQGWVLRVFLRGLLVDKVTGAKTNLSIDMQSTPNGAQHVFNVPATTTTEWQAANYGYSVRAVHSPSGEVYEVDNGTIDVLGDMQTATGGDYRSHAQKVLDAVEAVIEGRATLDQERYRINNRELYRTPLSELRKLRAQYRAEVNREKAKACGKSLFSQTIRVTLR